MLRLLDSAVQCLSVLEKDCGSQERMERATSSTAAPTKFPYMMHGMAVDEELHRSYADTPELLK